MRLLVDRSATVPECTENHAAADDDALAEHDGDVARDVQRREDVGAARVSRSNDAAGIFFGKFAPTMSRIERLFVYRWRLEYLTLSSYE